MSAIGSKVFSFVFYAFFGANFFYALFSSTDVSERNKPQRAQGLKDFSMCSVSSMWRNFPAHFFHPWMFQKEFSHKGHKGLKDFPVCSLCSMWRNFSAHFFHPWMFQKEFNHKGHKERKGFFFVVICALCGNFSAFASVDTITGIRYIRNAASAARYQWSSVRVLCTPDGRASPAVTRGAKGEAG
jgi:hypothetical protein